MRALLVSFVGALVAVPACDSRTTPPADPWAVASPTGGSPASAAPASDPWATATPSAAPVAPEPPARAASPLPDGEWKCDLVGTTWMNGQRYTQTMNVNGFSLAGATYTSSKEGSGTVEVEGSYATFHGGGFDNWRGAFNTHKDGSLYLVFGGASHREALPEHGSTVNDIQCEPAATR